MRTLSDEARNRSPGLTPATGDVATGRPPGPGDPVRPSTSSARPSISPVRGCLISRPSRNTSSSSPNGHLLLPDIRGSGLAADLDDLPCDPREEIDELVHQGGERCRTRPGGTLTDPGGGRRGGLRPEPDSQVEHRPADRRSSRSASSVRIHTLRSWSDRTSAGAPIRPRP